MLGFAGARQPDEKLSLKFGSLINDAAGKKPKYPLVVFLDTNLPFRTAHRVYGPVANGPAVPSPYMRGLLDRIRKERAIARRRAKGLVHRGDNRFPVVERDFAARYKNQWDALPK